jgi:ribose transport system substrate-binding protein
MIKLCQYGIGHKRNWVCLGLSILACALILSSSACRSRKQITIAVIPQTEGSHWDPAHAGAEAAAEQTGAFIYWNAPAREDDVEGQIALVERVVNDNYQGLVLAPDQALSLISPVRRALLHGIPTVIIGSPLAIPAGGNLFYILNDDAEGGRMAAQRVADLLKGHGTVALLGINPNVTGIMIRARSFEEFLGKYYPGIRISDRQIGSFNIPHEQQVAEETLRNNPDLDVIVALTSTTVFGALPSLQTTPTRHNVKIICFDISRLYPLEQEIAIDSVIQSDTRAMGQQAVELIHARQLGQPVPAIVYLHPKLISRENMNTPEVRQMLSLDWKLGHWNWSSTR